MSCTATVLKRWKRCWLVLYQNGEIRLFEKPDNPVAEHMESIGSNCLSILTGQQVKIGYFSVFIIYFTVHF